jgi:SAM-dependent methyltransferase
MRRQRSIFTETRQPGVVRGYCFGGMDPRDIVRSGYDAVSTAYRADNAPDGEYADWLADLAGRLPAGAGILDLGCGCGVPAARWLTQRGFRVLGVDLSPVQVRRARQLVPAARFVCEDMTRFEVPMASLDAVVCLYAIIHVPLDEQPTLMESIHRWLRPGGWLLITVGNEAWTGTENNWCDVPDALMYWAHESAATYADWMESAKFRIEWSRFIPEDDGGHVLVLAEAR